MPRPADAGPDPARRGEPAGTPVSTPAGVRGNHRPAPAPRRPAGDRETFWSQLPVPEQQVLEALGTLRRFTAGAALLREHEQSSHVLVLRRGYAKVACHGDDGYQVVLGIRDPGDLVGELASLDEEPRSASVYAINEVEALVVPSGRFFAFVRTHPDAGAALHRSLSARLREADRYRKAAATQTIEQRLAALLLELGDRYGEPDSSGAVLVELPLAQDDLAGLLLTSRRTIGRALMKLRAQGVVLTGRRAIVLRRPDRLAEIRSTGYGR